MSLVSSKAREKVNWDFFQIDELKSDTFSSLNLVRYTVLREWNLCSLNLRLSFLILARYILIQWWTLNMSREDFLFLGNLKDGECSVYILSRTGLGLGIQVSWWRACVAGRKPWVCSLHQQTPMWVGLAWIFSFSGDGGRNIRSWSHSEFEASLGHLRP